MEPTNQKNRFSIYLIMFSLFIIATVFITGCNRNCGIADFNEIKTNNQYYLENPTLENCEKIKMYAGCSGHTGEELKGKCYLELYKQTKNKEYCEKILNLKNMEYSINDFVECLKLAGKNEQSICSMVHNYDEYKQCANLLNVSINLSNEFCSSFDYKENCFKTLAVKTGDPKICLKEVQGSMQVECIKNIALNNNDVYICENLKNCYLSKDEYSYVFIEKPTETLKSCVNECISYVQKGTDLYLTNTRVRSPITIEELNMICQNDSNKPSMNTSYRFVGSVMSTEVNPPYYLIQNSSYLTFKTSLNLKESANSEILFVSSMGEDINLKTKYGRTFFSDNFFSHNKNIEFNNYCSTSIHPCYSVKEDGYVLGGCGIDDRTNDSVSILCSKR